MCLSNRLAATGNSDNRELNENSKADCLWYAAISLNVARLECSIRVYNHKYSITVKIHYDCFI